MGVLRFFRRPLVRRALEAMFATGGEITMPPEVPGAQPITVQIPQGVLRSRTNQTLIVAGVFTLLNLFNVDLGFSEADANTALNVITAFLLGVAGIFRTKATNLTRG